MRMILGLLVCLFTSAWASSSSKHYELSMCAIFKNEGAYLKEWIEFHKLQGVEHFFLYNNNSTDDYQTVLEPYVASGDVTLVDWLYTYEPGKANYWIQVQCNAYMDCINKYGSSTGWLAIVDLDEFLFCPTGKTLPSFLQDFKKYGAVAAYCLIFGTSNVANVPEDSLMIEVLTRCNPLSDYRNASIKSIVQPKYVQSCHNPHLLEYKEGYFCVDFNGDRLGFKNIRFPSYDTIRVNHYWTRTEDHFYNRKVGSRNDRRTHETASVLERRARGFNDSSDTAIMQFVPALRKQMGYD